jgi:hypothetical protein
VCKPPPYFNEWLAVERFYNSISNGTAHCPSDNINDLLYVGISINVKSIVYG